MKIIYFFILVNFALGHDQKVAIVGAGMAGLSTANRFLEKGFQNFEIFEALERYGGRVFPVPYKDGFLQHGAQFINGNKNPLFDLASRLGVVSDVYPDFGHLSDAVIRFGKCPVKKEDIEVFRNFAEPLDMKYHNVAFEDEKKSYDETVKSMFEKDYAEFLKEQKAESGFRRNVFDSLSLTLRSYFEFEYAARWEELSLRAITEWDDLGEVGVSYTTNKIGYTAIINHLRSKIPDSKIHFNHRISNIDYSGPETTLTLVNGTRIEGFDYVIVTSSIGHLKKFSRKMFTPPLPKRKLEAIDKIGMGTSAKVFFEFPDVSWKDDILIPLPVEGCLGRKNLDPIESEFNTFQSVPWAPNILMAWIAGHGPRKVDNIEDEQLSRIVTKLLRDVYRNDSIPVPSKVIRNRWTHDDLFGGSYSFVTFEQAQARIRHSDMSIPVKKNGKIKLQFAGEGTHHRIFQTCVGAFLSGRREADRIISLIS